MTKLPSVAPLVMDQLLSPEVFSKLAEKIVVCEDRTVENKSSRTKDNALGNRQSDVNLLLSVL